MNRTVKSRIETTGCVLYPATYNALVALLQNRYPDGAPESKSPPYGSVKLLEDILCELNEALDEDGLCLSVDLEADHYAGDRRIIRSLIVFNLVRPHVVDLSVSTTLVRIKGRPIYIAHESGAEMLLDGILAEIGAAIECWESET